MQAGASVDATDVTGVTPLWFAAAEGALKVVRQLVQGGASVNAASKLGATPLLVAAKEGHGNVVTCKHDAVAVVSRKRERERARHAVAQ